MPRIPWMDDLMNGSAVPEDLDDHIDRWHDLPSDDPDTAISLHEYLGLTWEEFSDIARSPALIPYIISMRKAGWTG